MQPADPHHDDTPPASSGSELQPISPAPAGVGRRLLRFLRDLFEIGVQTAILTFLMIYFVAQATVVHGQSMEPNLHTDQRLIVEKISYRIEAPQRGDIVVVRVDEFDQPLIKRIIGLPGETVEIRDNHVFINGLLLLEDYLPIMRQQQYGPVVVPQGHVLVMGDNRNVSNDSRYFGPVPIDNIMGKAWASYWPLQDFGLVK